ncbi:hypothetical protein FYZ48_01835 [Gimesia chilikensis]|uniref:hypothetical protein n=1 Tax=Gimesia chilikensis TaxID=2605989 RepID=UPI0011EDFA35|nr:hypothetical protein [Gimesia chilikensis]KAA0143137.1 hypothetical protein FYZ48_01835 [Gimesia chilikensis]
MQIEIQAGDRTEAAGKNHFGFIHGTYAPPPGPEKPSSGIPEYGSYVDEVLIFLPREKYISTI